MVILAIASAESAAQTSWSKVAVAYNHLYNDVLSAYAGTNIPPQKKAYRLSNFYLKVDDLLGLVDESCSDFAGSGDPNDFINPDYDSKDICLSLNNFYASVKSFHHAFVCNDRSPKKALRMKKLIQRQKQVLFNKKFKQLKCNETPKKSPTEPPTEVN